VLVNNYAWILMATLSTAFGDVRSDVILYSLSEFIDIIHLLLLLMMMMIIIILTPDIIGIDLAITSLFRPL